MIIFSDDPDATEKLIDKIERLKKRQGVMKRGIFSAKRIAKASPILASLRKQSPNFLRKISPAELAFPIPILPRTSPSPVLRSEV